MDQPHNNTQYMRDEYLQENINCDSSSYLSPKPSIHIFRRPSFIQTFDPEHIVDHIMETELSYFSRKQSQSYITDYELLHEYSRIH